MPEGKWVRLKATGYPGRQTGMLEGNWVGLEGAGCAGRQLGMPEVNWVRIEIYTILLPSRNYIH